MCLTGVSSAGRRIEVDAGGVNREIVLQNDAVVGSVNTDQHHFRQAVDALATADRSWLERLITRRVPLAHAAEAFEDQPDDVKIVIDLHD